MKVQTTWIAVLLGAVAMMSLPGTSAAQSLINVATGPSAPAALLHLGHFAEPLVATARTTSEEDDALRRAVAAYEQRRRPDDLSSLTTYVREYPHSGWTPALLTNIGLSSLHYGYFSRALDAWQQAWREGRAAEGPEANALVDRAVGELARLYANLGHMERLAALFGEIGDRPISGSATEAVQVAREQLDLVAKDPRHLFLCGPLALESLLLAQGAEFQQVSFLQWYRAGPSGTNLAEVGGLADRAKLEHRIVFRVPGQIRADARGRALEGRAFRRRSRRGQWSLPHPGRGFPQRRSLGHAGGARHRGERLFPRSRRHTRRRRLARRERGRGEAQSGAGDPQTERSWAKTAMSKRMRRSPTARCAVTTYWRPPSASR